jgi:signal-transduction protein with cAMP-binding, CBS, and nucleotidyltransferase domain
MVTVKKIMSKDIQKVDGEITVKEAAKVMKTKKIGCLLVEKDNVIIGIVTETDIVRRLIAEGKDPESTQVKIIMSSPLITIDAGKSIINANDMMDKNNIRHLAVKEDNIIIGVVSSRDMMRPLYMEGEEW